MFGRVRVKEYEIGLLFEEGDFIKPLAAGTYRFISRLWSRTRSAVEIVNVLETKFEHELLDILVRNFALRELLEVVDLADNERALVWKNGRLAYILGPGRHAFWKQPNELIVERFDANVMRFDHPKLDAVLGFSGGAQWLKGVDVADHEDVLLIKDGQIVDQLGAGRHAFWTYAGRLSWHTVDLREQLADVAGQEIMTKDKVTLRVNLVVSYQVEDARTAVLTVSDYAQAVYREAQLALRAAVGTRRLDELLADKESIGGEVKNVLTARANEFGVRVKGVGLKDIILPGEMKLILNQVIEAEKAAQANLIKRREETAAARSQANTAKLLADNPTLARMKELELLQEVLAGAKVSFVMGQGNLTQQVTRLIEDDQES